MAIGLCVIAFVITFVASLRSVVAGLVCAMAVGYGYGITRANVLESASHFVFDAAVLGLYLGWIGSGVSNRHGRTVKLWMILLIGWPVLVSLVPIQHPLIQAVGLRGNVFFVPFLLLGASLDEQQVDRLATWLAVLNLGALVFAAAEYFKGVEPFYPLSPVTEIIYRSKDVSGFTAHRIPACFANSASYGGVMAATIPWLVGAWIQPEQGIGKRWLLAAGIAAAIVGVFLSAFRSVAILLFVLMLVVTFSRQMRASLWLGWAAMLVIIGFVVSNENRLQRFTTLSDPDLVIGRVANSTNAGSWLELARDYPMGNGMGGGGTSIPYFLQDLVRNPIGMENEYSRIMLEQGIPGMLIWVTFIIWALTRSLGNSDSPWYLGRRLLWYSAAFSCGSALIGTGMLTAIPGTALFLLGLGWITSSKSLSERGEAELEYDFTEVTSADSALAGSMRYMGSFETTSTS